MYVLVAASLAAVPARRPRAPSRAAAGPSRPLAARPEGAALVVIAMIGTTVAPWQFFFQQSNVVDKRITPRWLSYERLDIAASVRFSSCLAPRP